MPYCDICHSETCEHQDRSCPCGCGSDDAHLNNNCVYDDAAGRHAKNLRNGKPDEQWVVVAMKSRPTSVTDVLSCGHTLEHEHMLIETGEFVCDECGAILQ